MSSSNKMFADNDLLAALPPEALAQWQPLLRRVDLPLRASLHVPHIAIQTVYFPCDGYVSLLVRLENGDSAEVGMIGREGIVGMPLILETNYSPLEALVQAAGAAWALDAAAFRQVLADHAAARTMLLRYAMAFSTQVSMTAACNSRHKVEQRLARWLLMAHDRSTGDEFVMTHDFLSMMLGVRRAGISVAAAMLQEAGLIRYRLGHIAVLDRLGLEAAACECYGVVGREYTRIIDPGR